MTAICVDDEKLLADHVTKLCRGLPAIDEAVSFSNPFAALADFERSNKSGASKYVSNCDDYLQFQKKYQ